MGMFGEGALSGAAQGASFGAKLGPWGALAGGAIGAGMAIRKAPSALDISRQRMKFIMENMNKIPGLAAAFRQYMVQGSGGEQGNLVGASNAFTSGLRSRLASSGLGTSGMGALSGAMGQSMLGQGMANMYQKYNLAGFDMANNDIMGGLQMSMGADDMKNRVIGGVVDAGGRMLDRVLYPRKQGYG